MNVKTENLNKMDFWNMDGKTCELCGSELFIRDVLEDSYEYCCLNCFNFNLIDKTTSLTLCEKYIEATNVNSLNYCKRFSVKDLIYVSLNARELAVREKPEIVNIEFSEVLWATLLIKDCLKSSFDGQEVCSRDNLYKLFSYYREKIRAENLLIQVQENYSFLFEDTLELKELVPNSPTITVDEKKYIVMNSWKWRHYIEALETIQLPLDIRKEKIQKLVHKKVIKRLEEIRKKNFS